MLTLSESVSLLVAICIVRELGAADDSVEAMLHKPNAKWIAGLWHDY